MLQLCDVPCSLSGEQWHCSLVLCLDSLSGTLSEGLSSVGHDSNGYSPEIHYIIMPKSCPRAGTSKSMFAEAQCLEHQAACRIACPPEEHCLSSTQRSPLPCRWLSKLQSGLRPEQHPSALPPEVRPWSVAGASLCPEALSMSSLQDIKSSCLWPAVSDIYVKAPLDKEARTLCLLMCSQARGCERFTGSGRGDAGAGTLEPWSPCSGTVGWPTKRNGSSVQSGRAM